MSRHLKGGKVEDVSNQGTFDVLFQGATLLRGALAEKGGLTGALGGGGGGGSSKRERRERREDDSEEEDDASSFDEEGEASDADWSEEDEEDIALRAEEEAQFAAPEAGGDGDDGFMEQLYAASITR